MTVSMYRVCVVPGTWFGVVRAIFSIILRSETIITHHAISIQYFVVSHSKLGSQSSCRQRGIHIGRTTRLLTIHATISTPTCT